MYKNALMPKFKTGCDVFCQEGDTPGGERAAHLTILLEDTARPTAGCPHTHTGS